MLVGGKAPTAAYLPKPEAVCAGILPGALQWPRERPGHPLGVAYPLPGLKAYLLCPAFISSLILVVNPAEVGNDHRDRQGNGEDTAQAEQMEPKIFPAIVLGTMSPYLKDEDKQV